MFKNNNKISFNNFKAFGDRMQSFSKKPITLIYGANSVGKSSLLHSMLFFEYHRVSPYQPQQSIQTNFAGDEINLADFDNFIHQHDSTRAINYEMTFTKDEDFEKLLTSNYKAIKELQKEGFLDREWSEELIKEELDRVNEGEIFSLAVKLSFTRNQDHLFLYDEDTLNKINTHNKQIRVIAFYDYCQYKNIDCSKFITSDKSYIINAPKETLEDFENLLALELKRFQNNPTPSEKTFMLFQSTIAKNILDSIDYYRYFLTIQEIKIAMRFSKSSQTIHYYLNSELIFSTNSLDEKIIFDKHNKLYQLITTQPNRSKDFDWNNHFSFNIPKFIEAVTQATNNEGIEKLIKNLEIYINKLFEDENNQYFSPLRFYPKREDMIIYYADKQKKLNSKKMTLSEIQRVRKIYKKSPFLASVFMFFYAKDSSALKDIANTILPDKLKLTPPNIYTTQKMWENLINSKEEQKKLNQWFVDMKLSYQVQVEEEITNRVIVTLRRINFNNPLSQDNSLHRWFNQKLFEPLCKMIRKVFSVSTLYKRKLKFIDTKTDTEVTPREMGLGISQILPVIISAQTTKDNTIYIEQPELHLHPAMQSEIADEFIKGYKENNNQFMIETHSEHLLLRVMKRMRHTAEGKIAKDDLLALTPDDVCLIYVDSNANLTYINELELDEDGSLLDPWPNGFFEEGYRERFE